MITKLSVPYVGQTELDSVGRSGAPANERDGLAEHGAVRIPCERSHDAPASMLAPGQVGGAIGLEPAQVHRG